MSVLHPQRRHFNNDYYTLSLDQDVKWEAVTGYQLLLAAHGWYPIGSGEKMLKSYGSNGRGAIQFQQLFIHNQILVEFSFLLH